jgi:iron transport multicopper oxidase
MAGTVKEANRTRTLFQNGSFFPPGNGTNSLPVLLQILNGADPTELLPKDDVYILPPNKTIEVSLPRAGNFTGSHPFHLHGVRISAY